jgi:hypothetical protein
MRPNIETVPHSTFPQAPTRICINRSRFMGTPADSKQPLAESALIQSPAWFPLEVIASPAVAVRLLQLDETAYRKVSFLDQRLLADSLPAATCSLETLWSTAAKLQPRAHYLFHTGHVGSTLVSRLVGEHSQLFCLREPALLRILAAEPATPKRLERLRLLVSLFSRTWRPDQRAVIKATSTVNELAADVLAGEDSPAAIFMYAQPLAYLRGILGGPNSRVEAKATAPARRQRLLNRLEVSQWEFDPRSEGELIAMNWLCEMVTLRQAAQRFPTRVLWVDFDAFLAAPAPGLASIFKAFGTVPPATDIEKLVTGPLMQQYSKAPEFAYDTALRQQVLRSADLESPDAIRRGMEWLNNVTGRYRLVANVTSRH